MKKVVVPVVLSLSLLAGGCTVMDVVGPRPNKDVAALAMQAAADSFASEAAGREAGYGDGYRDLRRVQADTLIAELQRLCGTEPSGAVPTSCDTEFDAAELPAPVSLYELVALSAEAAPRLPEESVALVTAQAVDAAAMHPVALEELVFHPVADPADQEAARALLEQEYEFAYALGLVKAFGDDATKARAEALEERSTARAEQLAAMLDTPPVPAAGYSFTDPARQPHDEVTAAALTDSLLRDVIAGWRLAAATASDQQWREAAIWLAAHAQRG